MHSWDSSIIQSQWIQHRSLFPIIKKICPHACSSLSSTRWAVSVKARTACFENLTCGRSECFSQDKCVSSTEWFDLPWFMAINQVEIRHRIGWWISEAPFLHSIFYFYESVQFKNRSSRRNVKLDYQKPRVHGTESLPKFIILPQVTQIRLRVESGKVSRVDFRWAATIYGDFRFDFRRAARKSWMTIGTSIFLLFAQF